MTAVNLELPWPPSVNDYWKPRVPGPGMYMTKAGKRYRRDAILMIRSQLGPPAPLAGELAVVLQLTPPRNIGDIDNVIKPVFDALEAALVFSNDRQIKRLEVDLLEAAKPGYVRLAVSVID
jgi:crossover junction endodeoxyribonuclease RusA